MTVLEQGTISIHTENIFPIIKKSSLHRSRNLLAGADLQFSGCHPEVEDGLLCWGD